MGYLLQSSLLTRGSSGETILLAEDSLHTPLTLELALAPPASRCVYIPGTRRRASSWRAIVGKREFELRGGVLVEAGDGGPVEASGVGLDNIGSREDRRAECARTGDVAEDQEKVGGGTGGEGLGIGGVTVVEGTTPLNEWSCFSKLSALCRQTDAS
mmetsp:Transcript_4284/g.10430  ORF Transcript_4284/g.10430 Transcript_4284/m.10430 type:complete len:157 (+) Transcript_4284:77-547(+)